MSIKKWLWRLVRCGCYDLSEPPVSEVAYAPGSDGIELDKHVCMHYTVKLPLST